MTANLTVWFDGGCPLCRREIALMRTLDRGAIEYVDLSGDAPNCPIARKDALARFHVLENGRLVSGAEAFAAVWRSIPLLRPLGIMARNRWVLAALERAYLVFLRFRPGLQRFAHRYEAATCRTPVTYEVQSGKPVMAYEGHETSDSHVQLNNPSSG